MKRNLLLLVVMISFGYSSLLIAQTTPSKSAILSLAEAQSQKFKKEKADALRWADQHGVNWRFRTSDKNLVELMQIINGFPVFYSTLNAEGASVIYTDRLYPEANLGFSLTGLGINMGIWDGGAALDTHQEFNTTGVSRISFGDDANYDDHATHVAATMIAGGFEPAARGMSYEASLTSYDWNNNISEMLLAGVEGMNVSQHSYGSLNGWHFGSFSGNEGWHFFGDPADPLSGNAVGFGLYEKNTRLLDSVVHVVPTHLIVKSAGNDRGSGPQNQPTLHWAATAEGGFIADSLTIRPLDGGELGYDCLPTTSVAKNVLTVGAVHANGNMSAFSSWGPTDDGRIKPDIVAKGVAVYSALSQADNAYATWNGTSMSGPMVSGSTGLLIQLFESLYPGRSLFAATMKAILIHTATDIGPEGPDYQNGWGLMNTEAAAKLIQANADNNEIHLLESVLNQGETTQLSVRAIGNEPLKATLVWTDEPGTAINWVHNNPELNLVNDLDMRMLAPDQSSVFPFILDPSQPADLAGRGDNFRDNVEVISIDNPMAGELYTITISHKNDLYAGSQSFSLIISGNESLGYVDLDELQEFDFTVRYADGMLFVEAPSNNKAPLSIQLIDMQGRILKEEQTSGSNTVLLNTTGFRGMGLIRLMHQNGSSVRKIYIPE